MVFSGIIFVAFLAITSHKNNPDNFRPTDMNKFRSTLQQWLRSLKQLVNISNHIDIPAATENIRQNIAFRGPNVLILMCAIFIASLGLNVNSTAVIIGAMLISPLMGPIIGIGLSIGTNDLDLLKASLRNWAVMVVISILVATVYFIISPLDMASPTELLARTNPTVYDVLIALFGGIAGILETSRKDKGTVLAGVAIATALMPPLCTVGYGISQLNWQYTVGALYLFFINSVFIALATLIMVRYMHFPMVVVDNPKAQKRRTRYISVVLVIMIIPSIFTGYTVIRENNFKRNANRFIADNKTVGKAYIYDHKETYRGKNGTIELFMAGEKLSDRQREELLAKAENYGFKHSQIVFREEAAMEWKPVTEQEIVKDIFENNEQQLRRRDEQIALLQARLSDLEESELPFSQLTEEIQTQYEEIESVILTQGKSINKAGEEQTMVLVMVRLPKDSSFDEADLQRLQSWLRVRLHREDVVVMEDRV